MNILVTFASKHGSTAEIAAAVAEELRRAGHVVDLHDAQAAPAAGAYDAVIIGSAIYAGSWQAEARRYVEDNQAALAQRPVWLFSSGPLGEENPQPQQPPAQLDELMARTQARGHENFVGKLDKERLSFGEKLIVKAVKAPYGDFRDWDAIRAWAREVGAAVTAVAPASGS